MRSHFCSNIPNQFLCNLSLSFRPLIENDIGNRYLRCNLLNKNPDNGDTMSKRMFMQDTFYLHRMNLEPLEFDQILQPIYNLEIAFLVLISHITSHEPCIWRN